jgi:hypothetical protein
MNRRQDEPRSAAAVATQSSIASGALDQNDFSTSTKGIEGSPPARIPPEEILRVTHDFNNLLTLILGYGETILIVLPDDHTLRALAEEICRAAKEGARLSKHLSSLAQSLSSSPP